MPESCWIGHCSLYLSPGFTPDQFAAVSSFAKTVSAYEPLLQDLYSLKDRHSISIFLSIIWMMVSILWYLNHKYLRWTILVSATFLSEHTYVEILLLPLHFICIAWHSDDLKTSCFNWVQKRWEPKTVTEGKKKNQNKTHIAWHSILTASESWFLLKK